MKHRASPRFWSCYRNVAAPVRQLADKNFRLLKTNPHHPSLHFKEIGEYRSVRVGLYYRALAIEVPDGILWFWIGTHSEYDKMVG